MRKQVCVCKQMVISEGKYSLLYIICEANRGNISTQDPFSFRAGQAACRFPSISSPARTLKIKIKISENNLLLCHFPTKIGCMFKFILSKNFATKIEIFTPGSERSETVWSSTEPRILGPSTLK